MPRREEFYKFLEARQQKWPGTLDATSTHDTKRSEDVRARLNVLSEMPDEWEQHMKRWSALNSKHKVNIAGQVTPDNNEEYFFYQTLLGVWPLDQEASPTLLQRVQEHLVKATREAMVHTRWTRPNQQHEDALQSFAARVLSAENREFLHDFSEFAGESGILRNDQWSFADSAEDHFAGSGGFLPGLGIMGPASGGPRQSRTSRFRQTRRCAERHY